MSNSSLVSFTKISPNKNSPRNHAIDTITIHCVVGQCSVESLGNLFASPSKEASSNYGIGYDGRIGMYVEEGDRSWCTSSASNDNRAVTIEVASDTYHPYAVTAKAYSAILDLVTDICKRNGIKELKWKADSNLIGQVDKQNMTAHRWFAAKACPGDYLYNRFGNIAAEVNRRLGVSGGSSSGGNSGSSSNTSTYVVVAGDSLWGIANGLLGDGSRYTEIKTLNGLTSDIIYVGQTLKIPVKSSGSNTNNGGSTIIEGSVVKVKNGAKTYTGGSLASFVYDRNHVVSELSGDRAVITYGGVVVAAVNVKDLTLVSGGGSSSSGSSTSKPSSPSTTTTIKEGSTVKVKNGAKTYDGGSLASFVYDRNHIVSELSGDRAVITYQGTVVAAVNIKDLTLVSGNSSSSTPSTPVKKEVKEGSTVKLKKGAKTYDGGSLADFVYNRNHVVSELSGDRAVITYGGVVVAAVNVKDLTVV